MAISITRPCSLTQVFQPVKSEEMVCLPCIVMPFLLFIWHRYIQPIVLKFWNPWKPADKTEVPSTTDQSSAKPSCPWKPTSGKPDEIEISKTNITESDDLADSKMNSPLIPSTAMKEKAV